MLSLLLFILYRYAKYKRGEYPLSILYYHHVFAQLESYHPDDLSAEQFEQQIQFLSKNFNILPMTEAMLLLSQNRLPAKALVLCFDDGYQDNANIAVPILKKYNCSATFFIATEGVERGYLWNDIVEQSIKRTRHTFISENILGQVLSLDTEKEKIHTYHCLVNYLKFKSNAERSRLLGELIDELQVTIFSRTMMDARQIKQLQQDNFTIAAHTHTHTILSTESDEQCHVELLTNKQYLEAIIGQPVNFLAFPNGLSGRDFTKQHSKIAKQLGFQAAFSTNDGGALSTTNPYAIPRFMPYRKQLPLFALSIAKIAADHV
jgi:peptidoglycan/xylan/chitin deacetylase (PgdA/CDA1 family)